MLSIIVIASFILPSVLGGCCLPARMSATTFAPGARSDESVLVDFTQKKHIIRPSGGKIEYLLTDRNVGKVYIKYRDGSCVIAPSDHDPIEQCIPENGPSVKSAYMVGVPVEVYTYILHHRTTTVVVTKDTCLPVLTTGVADGFPVTSVYTNVNTAVSDVSDFDQDTSNCSEEELL